MFKLSTVYTSWLQRLHQTIFAHSAQPGCGAALDQAFYFRITQATRSVAGHFAQQLMTGSPVKRRSARPTGLHHALRPTHARPTAAGSTEKGASIQASRASLCW